jgi:hypothetical protein
MDRDLISACAMFLGPSTILFAAVALAPTEGLKTGISLVGFMTASVWLVQMVCWQGLLGPERVTTSALALIFVTVWAVSAFVHGMTVTGNRDHLPEFMRVAMSPAKSATSPAK